MTRVESPFRQQPLPSGEPPSEPRLTAREGVRILIHELQGQTINLRQVLESGVEPVHAHCGDVLGLLNGSNGILSVTDSYERYFFDKYGIRGSCDVNSSDSLLLTEKVTVFPNSYSRLFKAGNFVQAFPLVDFKSPFASSIHYAFNINTSRGGRRSNFYTVDLALGDGIPRSEEVLVRCVERGTREVGIDKLFVTDQGHKLLTAFLAARV